MSKGKNQNKNNKTSQVPVKSQPLKPQKAAVIKPTQVAVNKNNQKTVTKPVGKPVAKVTSNKMPEVNNKKQLKPTKKELDIAGSDEDEDEDDVEFDIDDDSDIDDVDLGDSDEDDDDLSIEDIDNSDFESIEMDENDINSNDDSEEDEEVEVKKETKATEKKEVTKVVEKKEVAKVAEKKEVTKVAEKKEAPKVVQKNEAPKVVQKNEAPKVAQKKEAPKVVEKKEPKIIDPSTKEGKILIEINKRKNDSNEMVVFVSNLSSKFTKETLTNFLKENNLPVVNVNLPGKFRKQGVQLRGYGFIRLANAEDARKTIEILNGKEIDGKKITASPYVCKKVYDDFNKVNFCQLMAHSYKDEDITEILKKHFKNVQVVKHMSTQYGLEFSSKEEAANIFNKQSITIEGRKINFNYVYRLKSNDTKKNDVATIPDIIDQPMVEEIDEKPAVVETVKETVKAGVKRRNCESSSDDNDEESEEVVKKTKMIDGSEVATKVEKKVFTPKKPIDVAKTPEKKNFTPQNNKGEKKGFNKSPGNGKAHFNKSPGDKKQFNKSPGDKKQFNKSPGEKKQFNKSPAGNRGKQSPGNKKFNKK